MRIDGGTKASAGQQAQSRFEQVLSRELSQTSAGRTPTESGIRTALSTQSRKSVPGSQRVGVDFKAAQAGKILKGVQDSARQILAKTMTTAAQTSQTAFAALGKAIDSALTKAQTIQEGIAEKAGGKDGPLFGKTAIGGTPGAETRSGETSTTRSAASGGAPASGTPGTTVPAPATAPTSTGAQGSAGAQGTASTPAATAALPLTATAGGERTAATAPTMMETPASPLGTTGTMAETAGAQEGRPLLALQEAPTTLEALLLHSPGLQAMARKAKAGGSTLSMVYMLGPNPHGAEFVSITTDDKGFITGPEIDIALTEGTFDTMGNWIALSGSGQLHGAKVTLEPDSDGCAFVTDGEDGVPKSVTAWLQGGEAIHAGVTAVRKLE